uniref:Putative secreted protein n=1 Tax=Ixodes ricinus TaxID=34613 RepID=A0A6B0V505_IXORI
MMYLAPGYWLLPLRTSSCILSMLNGVTISGKVRFWAIERGTPTSLMRKLGSGVMTVRAEKSTRLPIRLPRMRPSLLFSRCLIDLSGRPDFCIALGSPGISLSTSVATWNWSILSVSAMMWAAAPLCSLRISSLLALTMSASLWVKSSWLRAEPNMTTAGRTASGGTGSTVMSIQSGLVKRGSMPRIWHSSSDTWRKISHTRSAVSTTFFSCESSLTCFHSAVRSRPLRRMLGW